MIRLTLLWLFLLGVGAYAFKDWYKSLCGLILLMAVIEHPDMPKSILGLQGLNPWNLLCLWIIFAWALNRGKEKLSWDMPGSINLLLLLYLSVILIGFVRLLADPAFLEETTGFLISEYLINSIKWVIPGLLLFDGCRSRTRFLWGLSALLAAYFLLGLQVIKWMPINAAVSGDDLGERSLKILLNEVGYHRVNLSMMLAGASWAIFATHPLAKDKKRAKLIAIAGVITIYAQALTAGRMGYVTWAVVGFIFCCIRWRRILLLGPIVAPVGVLIVSLVVPGVVDRMLQGFSPDSVDYGQPVGENPLSGPENGPDMYTVTAGRTFTWPFVIEKIGESPILGFGREAMIRTGVTNFLLETYGESFPHPHNAYLQLLLDNGVVGFLPVLCFYLVVLNRGISLFRDSRSPVFIAIGGVTCALVFALLVASMGSQTFYPREGAVGMWCAIGLMLRVSVERARLSSSKLQNLTDWNNKRQWTKKKRTSPPIISDAMLWQKAA